jgi:hypothetical protein
MSVSVSIGRYKTEKSLTNGIVLLPRDAAKDCVDPRSGILGPELPNRGISTYRSPLRTSLVHDQIVDVAVDEVCQTLPHSVHAVDVLTPHKPVRGALTSVYTTQTSVGRRGQFNSPMIHLARREKPARQVSGMNRNSL